MSVSVIVLAFGHLAETRQAVSSILLNTRNIGELILVDNGSTDRNATLDYFESIKYPRGTVVVRLQQNRGFAGGLNAGLKRATGDYIAFVSNDCQVTPGWLPRLIQTAQTDPSIGLVGPLTNYASGVQGVPITTEYRDDDPASLHRFATDVAREFKGQTIDTNRLVFFAFLVTRRCLDAVGLLDERFGFGNFEDDQMCRRVLDAGFRCVVDLSTFIHHAGSITMRDLGEVGYAKLLDENRRKYQEWLWTWQK